MEKRLEDGRILYREAKEEVIGVAQTREDGTLDHAKGVSMGRKQGCSLCRGWWGSDSINKNKLLLTTAMD